MLLPSADATLRLWPTKANDAGLAVTFGQSIQSATRLADTNATPLLRIYRRLQTLSFWPYLKNLPLTVSLGLNQMGAGGVICYTAGFGEMGEDGAKDEARLIEATGDMALIGPNCYGMINYVGRCGSLAFCPWRILPRLWRSNHYSKRYAVVRSNYEPTISSLCLHDLGWQSGHACVSRTLSTSLLTSQKSK